MVRLTIINWSRAPTLHPSGRLFLRKDQHQSVDSLKISVKAGSGGSGFPKYGGLGGKGGDVYLRGTGSLQSLSCLGKTVHLRAGNGSDSLKSRLVGPPGDDVTVKIPRGVDVRTPEGGLLGTTDKSDSLILVARGGQGGCRTNNWIGQIGEERNIILELKLLADVGLVGYPNAGKSTILKACSRASPRIANYPFTTLQPNLGAIEYDDHRRIMMADLPGLIEDSHKNRGLGIRFLRHVERTRLLAFVLDVSGIQLSPENPLRTPFHQLLLLHKEICMYNDSLLRKPAVLVISKMDKPYAKEKYEQFLDHFERVKAGDHSVIPDDLQLERPFSEFEDIITISAKFGDSVTKLRERIREIIDEDALSKESASM